jgi:hypothetical protein
MATVCVVPRAPNRTLTSSIQSRHTRKGDKLPLTALFAVTPDLAQLVRSGIVVDAVEGFIEVVGQGVGGGDDVVSGLDLDGSVAAGGADELLH